MPNYKGLAPKSSGNYAGLTNLQTCKPANLQTCKPDICIIIAIIKDLPELANSDYPKVFYALFRE